MGREGGEWEYEEEVQDREEKREKEGERGWVSAVLIRSLLVHITTYSMPSLPLVLFSP